MHVPDIANGYEVHEMSDKDECHLRRTLQSSSLSARFSSVTEVEYFTRKRSPAHPCVSFRL